MAMRVVSVAAWLCLASGVASVQTESVRQVPNYVLIIERTPPLVLGRTESHEPHIRITPGDS